MLIKSLDCKKNDVAILESMLSHNALTAHQKKQITKELATLKKGNSNEKKAAYEIDFYFQNTPNFAVIHDLRLEHNGRVAQIDHLIINRFFDFFVLESKHFSDSITITENGDFLAQYGSKSIGIPSPVEQNEKHIVVLKDLIQSGQLSRPTSLGLNIRASFQSVILISSSTSITRPTKAKLPWLNTVIKADQISQYVDGYIDKMNAFKALLKIPKTLFDEELSDFANALASHHKPIQIDWHARFGVVNPHHTSLQRSAQKKIDPQTMPPQKKSSLACARCSVSINYTVARFCWFNKKRFNSQLYCMACQTYFPPLKRGA